METPRIQVFSPTSSLIKGAEARAKWIINTYNTGGDGSIPFKVMQLFFEQQGAKLSPKTEVALKKTLSQALTYECNVNRTLL